MSLRIDREGAMTMEELIRSNDMVLMSFVQSLLDEVGIRHFVADENMSVLEGSLGVLARRLMVDADSAREARTLLTDAGLGAELRPVTV